MKTMKRGVEDHETKDAQAVGNAVGMYLDVHRGKHGRLGRRIGNGGRRERGHGAGSGCRRRGGRDNGS